MHGEGKSYLNEFILFAQTMMLPICIGDGPYFASRIGKGKDYRSLGCREGFIFYASDTQLEGMAPYSIGEAGEDDNWRHIVTEGTYAGNRGWKHNFTFYTYQGKKSGMIPYAVGHANNEDGGWKYKVIENVRSTRDYNWKNEFSLDFIFYAFPINPEYMFPISVGCYSDHKLGKVCIGVGLSGNEFPNGFTFNALSYDHPESVPFSVDSKGDGEEFCIREEMFEELCGYDDGWKKQEILFFAFKNKRPGTVPFAIGHRGYSNGWEYRMLMNSNNGGGEGWIHDCLLFTYPFDKSQLLSVAIGFEGQHGCARLKQSCSLDERGFKNSFSLFAYKFQYPGTIPISIGQAGAEHNNTLRSCIVAGTNANHRGWEHAFTIYVFMDKKKGTTPFAVGHAEFALGGWKYNILQNRETAAADGWCHDFSFYAYSR